MVCVSEKPKSVSEISSDDAVAGMPFQFDHPVFAGARIIDESVPADVVRNRMYELGEAFFRQHGPRCVEQGWSVYPQTRDGGRRPALINGQNVRPSEYKERLPTAAEVGFWAAKAPSSNVALQLGPSSGYTFALDIDVDCDADQQWIVGLAFQHLGVTPLRRSGRRPALIYRRDPAQQLRSSSYGFESGAGMIEILGDGKSLTIYGAHHSTGDYFRWPGADQPALVGPEVAPVVTAEQLRAFLDVVDHWRALKGYHPKVVTHFTADTVEYDGKVSIPPRRMEWGVWERQRLGKLLVDGRKEFLFRRAGDYSRFNAAAIANEEASKAIFAAYLAEAFRYIARTGKWSSDAAIQAEAADQFRRARISLLEGRLKAAVIAVREDGTRETASVGGVLAIEGDLGDAASWIAPAGSKARRKSPSKIVRKTDADHAPDSVKAKKLALLNTTARIALGECVSSEVVCIIDAFWDRVWDHHGEISALIAGGKSPLPEMLREVSALIAPTGAGKTSTLIRRFVHFVETRGKLPFAIGIFLPGHANTLEAKLVAERAGAIDVWSEALDASRGAGVQVMQLKGKVAAGCILADKMARLQQAQISVSGMCQTPRKDILTGKQAVDEDGQKIFDTCVHKDNGCPVWTQIRLAQQADLILLAHAYLTSPLPKEVSARLGVVIIDERFWPEVVSTAFLPIEALDQSRKLPRLTDTDERDGITQMDYVIGRDRAVVEVKKAIARGECIARALASLDTRP